VRDWGRTHLSERAAVLRNVAKLLRQQRERARSIAGQLEVGSVCINGATASDPRLPVGGVKLSGYGRELGAAGMRELVNIQSVWIGPAR
jgi:succinate-semialdehyde dehydrogenase/glutarate-semialdehyde dehydrogenase